jgi:hypothetical protein
MKKKHLFVFYCTLLLPIGAIVGAGIGSATGWLVPMVILGSAAGVAASVLLVRSSAPQGSP